MEKAPIAICLDMDETLAGLVAACIEVCRKKWPDQQWKLPKYGRYGHWFNDCFTDEQREELYSVIKTEEFYVSLPPVLSPFHHNASIESLSRVCWDRYEHVMVVTARIGFCPDPVNVTREYLRLHKFADVDALDIIAIDGKTSKLSKVPRTTLFVDDSVSVADDVGNSRNHHMIMVSHPWNDGYTRKSNNIRAVPARRVVEAVNSFADEYVGYASQTT